MKTSRYCITNGDKFKLKDYSTSPPDDSNEKKELKDQLSDDIQVIKKLQEQFFVYDRLSILMIFQAMDTAGKDGAIKHVTSGINPQGFQVFGFRAPSEEEYKHDYLWRHHKFMPERGKIGIHNRSHYEFVTSCRVNPEFVLKEHLPNIKKVEDLTEEFWEKRYDEIKNFESILTSNGTVILKFFLHVSKEEQKNRLLDRIDEADKNWKFDLSDLKARNQWDLYMDAYEKAISQTAVDAAPWYVIPADDKWFARALIARTLKETLKSLEMQYPQLNEDELSKLQIAKQELLKS